MFFTIIGVAIILAAEIASLLYKKAYKGRKVAKTNAPRGYLYLFLSAAILSVATIWVYIVNAEVMSSGPPFIINWLIGIPFCLVILSVMAHSVRALIKSLPIPPVTLGLSVAIAIITILLAANVLFVASDSGHLLLR